MDNKITIEIPINYLIQIAVYGNMGTGDLPDSIKLWATKKLTETGYDKQLKEAQRERLDQLRESIKNVLGKEEVQKIDEAIGNAIVGLSFAMELKNNKKQ